jgi:hypothetical protein
MDLNFFAKRRIWDDDFAKHVAWVFLGRFGWEQLALASGNEGYDI